MKITRKLKANYFLTKRAFNRADATDKAGVIIVSTFIVPMLLFICANIVNGAHISFGF